MALMIARKLCWPALLSSDLQTPRHHTAVCCPSSNANMGVCCSHTMVQFNKPHKTWHNACCCCYSPTTSVTPLDVGRTPARPGVGPVGQEASLGRCASTLKICTKVGPLTGTCCCRNMLSQSANKHNASKMHKTDRERAWGVQLHGAKMPGHATTLPLLLAGRTKAC